MLLKNGKYLYIIRLTFLNLNDNYLESTLSKKNWIFFNNTIEILDF